MEAYFGEALVLLAVVTAAWRIVREMRLRQNGLDPDRIAERLAEAVRTTLPDPLEDPIPIREELESLNRRMDALGAHVDERLQKMSGIWGSIQKARKRQQTEDDEEMSPEEAQRLLDADTNPGYGTIQGQRRLTLAEIEAKAQGD